MLKNTIALKLLILILMTSLISCSGSDSPAPTKSGDGGNTTKPLVAPAIINAQSDTSNIIINWPIDGNVEYYELYWSTTSGTGTAGTLIPLQPGANSYTHQFLEDGSTPLAKATTYYYTVVAVKGTKKSTASNEVSAVLKDKPLPAKPANVTITAQTTSITTTWDNDTSITNYNVYWSTTSGTGISGTKIQIATGQNSFKHEFVDAAKTPLAVTTDYFYVVTAQNSNGESITSAEVTGRLVEKPVSVLPQPPTNITLVSQNSQIQLSWSLDAAVTRYNVYWSTVSGTGTAGDRVELAVKTNNFTHEFLTDGTTRLSNGVDFYYVVTAFDANIESSPSMEFTARLKNKPWIMPLFSTMLGY